MGEGGDAPPLASKNPSPPLEQKTGDLQKIWWNQEEMSGFFFAFSTVFPVFTARRGFKRGRLTFELKQNYLSPFSPEYRLFLGIFLFRLPLPPPLPLP